MSPMPEVPTVPLHTLILMLVYLVIYDSGQVSLEHLLLLRGWKSVEPINPESIIGAKPHSS